MRNYTMLPDYKHTINILFRVKQRNAVKNIRNGVKQVEVMRGKRLPSRNTYFDYLRGVAILMVVGIHTYSGNHELNRTLTECIQLIVINSFNCAVPLFLAISGYFIARKKLSTFSNISSFWKKQIPTVYIPCLIFSLPWLILHCVSIYYNGGGI